MERDKCVAWNMKMCSVECGIHEAWVMCNVGNGEREKSWNVENVKC